MVSLFGVDDVGEGDEAESADVSCVEGAVVGGGVFAVRMRDEVFAPWGSGGFGDAGGGASDGHSGGLMRGGHDDFDVVWVEVAVCDGDGGGVEDRGDVVLRSDVRGDGWGGGCVETIFLDVSLENLGRCRGDKTWGGGRHAARRGREAIGLRWMLGGGGATGDGGRWHCRGREW